MVVLGASGSFSWSLSESSGRGSGLSLSFWNSKTEIFCGLPSSSDGEVAWLQTFDGFAGFVFHRDVDDHQVAGGGELGDGAVGLERDWLRGRWDDCCARRKRETRRFQPRRTMVYRGS